MKLGVVILNFRRPSDTVACAHAILQNAPGLLILVDNASGDDSISRLTDFASSYPGFYAINATTSAEAGEKALELPPGAKILLIKSDKNRGYAAGNNLGLKAALSTGCDYVWILNNDAFVEPQAMQEVKNALAEQADERIGLWGTTVMQGSTNRVQCIGGGHTNLWTGLSRQAGHDLEFDVASARFPGNDDLNYICGASVIVSSAFVEKVGLLDEKFFLYCEEQDWAIRGMRQGFKLGVIPKAIVRHFEGSTTGMNEGRRPPRPMARLACSRLRLARKHRPLAMVSVGAGLIFACLRLLFRFWKPPADNV